MSGVNVIRGDAAPNPWANDPDYGGVHEDAAGVPEEVLRGFDAGG
jgi:hypothetical protein